jgi:hypothetical protein
MSHHANKTISHAHAQISALSSVPQQKIYDFSRKRPSTFIHNILNIQNIMTYGTTNKEFLEEFF